MDDVLEDAPARILQAAQEELVLRGAGALAMHDVADRAGVSKGLIHYHYHDKDALLMRVAGRLGARIAMRARAALERSSTASAMDDVRAWVLEEIALGEWRGLLALGESAAVAVRTTAEDALAERRSAVEELMQRLFALLGAHPRISRTAVGDLAIVLVSGLVAEASQGAHAQAAVDAAVLSLLALSD